MNKEKKYLDLGKSLLSGPYLVWMTGFTIIPLLMILWYGLTGRDGALHWKISCQSQNRII